jgi:hypothetical protein
MDYSSTLSNDTIIIIIVIVVIIIVIIILIAIFNDNNNNNNNNNNGESFSKIKIDENINNETKEKLDLILFNQNNQNKQIEIISDALNSISNLSTDKDQSISNNDNINDETPSHEKIYYHKDETLNSSEIEKLDLSDEPNNANPTSIDFQHESFSDSTEFFEGQSIDEPSLIKKDTNFLGFTDINNLNNQKFPVKDKSSVKRTNIPLPKSAKIETILNSDLSSPDDETIIRVNHKIPLPKAYQKINK